MKIVKERAGKDKNMETTKMERIAIDLPQHVIFAMRGLEKPEEVKKK